MEIQGGLVKCVIPHRGNDEWGIECKWCRLNWSPGCQLYAHRIANGEYIACWKIIGVESMSRKASPSRSTCIIVKGDDVAIDSNDIVVIASRDAEKSQVVESSKSIARKMNSSDLYAVISRLEKLTEEEVSVEGPYFGQVAANRKASSKIREAIDLTAQIASIKLDLNLAVICHDGTPIIAVHYDFLHPNLLDFYAKKYLFDRNSLTLVPLDVIGIAANDVDSFTRGNMPGARR